MWSYGVKDVVIIQRGDARADGVVEVFSKAWRERGGEVEGDPVRYNPDQIDFSTYLQTANLEAQAAKAKYPEGEQVGLLLLTYDEDRSIVSQIGDYLPLYDCVTFSTNSHRNLKTPDYFAQNAQASHLRIFTPHLRPFSSSKIDELAARYPKDGAHTLRESFTYLYDAAWAIATSVLATRSTDASLVAAVFPEACSRLYGASGWCRLNQDGDRAALPFEVWFYGTGTSSLAGVYVPDTDTMEWNTSELGYTPTGP
jgi:branched-chain amino acid transport system substrate-binding protein